MPHFRSAFGPFGTLSFDGSASDPAGSPAATSNAGLPDPAGVTPIQIPLLEAVLGRLVAGVCVYDSEGTLAFCNERFAHIHGLDRKALATGLTPSDITRQAAVRLGRPLDWQGEYLVWFQSLRARGEAGVRTVRLADERTFRADHFPLPNGAFVVTYDDVTAEIANAEFVNERFSLQMMFDAVPDYLWVKDADCRFLMANKALAKDWGYTPAEMVGLSDRDFHAPERAEQFETSERAIIEHDTPMINRPEFVLDKIGKPKWLSSTKMPLKDSQGTIFGIIGISRDITELTREVAFRKGHTRILEMVAMSAPIRDILERLVILIEEQLEGIFGSVLLMSADGARLHNGASPHLHPDYTAAVDGFPIGPQLGSCGTAAYLKRQVVVSDISTDPLWAAGRDLAAAYGYRSCWSTPIISHAEVLGTFALYSRTARSPTADEMAMIEHATQLAGIAIERQTAEERIRYAASHDALTGLANRSMLDALFARAIESARRRNRSVLVLFIDLDEFKSVNDRLGHHVGDGLLKEIARRLKACVRDSDDVIRLGGDEFVILLTDRPGRDDDTKRVVKRILAAVSEPMTVETHPLAVRCSIGVSAFPRDGDDPEALLGKADGAMYRAKQEGRNTFAIHRRGG